MKKIVLAVGLLFAGFGTGAAASVSQSVTTTTVNSAMLHLEKGESLTYTLAGTATGQIQLKRSEDGTNFESTGVSLTGAGVVSLSGTIYNEGRSANYRWSTVGYGTGTWVVTLADVDDFVSETKNNKKNPIMQIFDDTLRLFGMITGGSTVVRSTATSTGSEGQYFSAYLSGNQAAAEGSLLVATTTVAGQGISVAVCMGTVDHTGWIGIAKSAASTGTVVQVYAEGTVLALTNGTVNPGDVLVSTAPRGYMYTDNTPTTGADVAVAVGAGPGTFGGLTKVKIR